MKDNKPKKVSCFLNGKLLELDQLDLLAVEREEVGEGQKQEDKLAQRQASPTQDIEDALTETEQAYFASRGIQFVPATSDKRSVLGSPDSIKRSRRVFRYKGNLILETNTFFIKTKPEYSLRDIKNELLRLGLVFESALKFAPRTYVFKTTDKADPLELSRLLYNDPRLEFAEPDFESIPKHRWRPPAVQYYANLWHLHNDGSQQNNVNPHAGLGIPAKIGADIHIEEAWDQLLSGGAIQPQPGLGVRLAIMEYGFDLSHHDIAATLAEPDLAVRIEDKKSYFNVSNILPHIDPESPNLDHGTAVAGSALAKNINGNISGPAPECTFIPITLGLNTTLSFCNGIVYAADPSILRNTPSDYSRGADILSISIGPPDLNNKYLVEAALDYATTYGRQGRGLVIVYALPNEFMPSDSDFIPTKAEVISVGRTAQDDRYSGSAYGYIDLVAPGTHIFTTNLTNAQKFEFQYSGELNGLINNGNGPVFPTLAGYVWNISGTSFSTPIIAGVVALLLQKQPKLSWREVKSILQKSADKPDLGFDGNIEYEDGNTSGTPVRTEDLSWTTQPGSGGKLLDNWQNLILTTPNSLLQAPVTAGADEPGVAIGIPYPLTHGTKFLELTGHAYNFGVGQVIIIGAQTYLQAAPVFIAPNPPTQLVVGSVDGFKIGDTILIGNGPATYVSGDTVKYKLNKPPEFLDKKEIEVWNPCGFKTGQFIRLKGGYIYGQTGAYTLQPDEIFEIKQIKTSSTDILFRLDANRTREYGYGDRVELAYTAEAVITAINISTKTLTITTTTPAEHFSHFDVDTRVELLNTETRQVLEIFPGDARYLRIDSLLFSHPAGTPVIGGLIPHFSPAYGYGRLNAGNAVKAALNYDHHVSNADLVIRDTLADNGINPLPNSTHIDSPDIWVRNDSDSNLGLPGYNTAGPHLDPKDSEKRKIFIRVKNIGNVGNFQGKIKVFLALAEAGIINNFDFPFENGKEELTWIDKFNQTDEIKALRSGEKGLYLLGEMEITANTLTPANREGTYEIVWEKDHIPPDNLDIQPYLLVMLTPFDGVKTGSKVLENSNLSFKWVQIIRRIRFKKDLSTLENLEKSIEISNFDPPSSRPFHILIEDSSQTFFPKNIRVQIQRKLKHTSTEKIAYHYDGSNWIFDGNQPAWIQLNATAADPQVAVNQFSFSGSFDTAVEQRRLKISVIVEDTAGNRLFDQSHIISFRSEIGAESESESQGGRFHFFTNTNILVNTRAFGPLSGTTYRLSSMHSNSGTAKALAVCDGIVCVQRNSLGNLNLILKPTQQPPFNFPNIRYIIYHNLKPASLLNGNIVAAKTTNRLTETVWDSQETADDSRQNKEIRMGLAPSPDQDAGIEALGYQLWYDTNSPQPGTERYKNGEPIDNLFFRPADDIQLPLVRGGWDIGEFVSGDFGLTIILSSGHYHPSLEIARGMDYILQVASAGSGNAAQQLENRWERETILHFMDPCAFFGAFYPFRLFVNNSGTGNLLEASNYDKKKKDDLYTDCLAGFQNKNKVYLSILSEYRFSFNFFQNYSNNLRIPDGSSYTELDYYGQQNWPVLILEPNNFAETDPGAKNVFRFYLPLTDNPSGAAYENPSPLLYLAQGYWDRLLLPFRNLKSKKKFREAEADTITGYTGNRIELAIPNYGANNQCEPVCCAIRLLVLKQADNNQAPSSGIVLRSQNPLDHLFCPLNLVHLAEQLPAAPQRSVVLEDEVYIDARQSPDLQMDFIGKTGIALSANQVALFTYADEVREKKHKSRSFGMTGAHSTDDSWIAAISNQHDNIESYKSNLLINGSPKPYVIIQDASNSFSGFEKVDPKELLPIIISNTEFQTIKGLIEDPSNFSALFPVYLGVRPVSGSPYVHYFDDNNAEYTRFELVLRGYKLNGSSYQVNEVSTSIEIYSYGTF